MYFVVVSCDHVASTSSDQCAFCEMIKKKSHRNLPEISTVRLLFQIVIDPEKTGKLYKIRVGLAEQTFGAQWFLEKVLCADVSLRKKEIILFKIKKNHSLLFPY